MGDVEMKFFTALKNVLGETYVRSPFDCRIYAKYEDNNYQHTVKELAESILKTINSTYDFSNRPTPVDGAIVNHPQLGTRLVEFDEYQHFTPMRAKVIELSKQILPLDFHEHYLELIESAEVKHEMQAVTKRTGFRKPVPGFQIENGRMFQRAYFDFLKDYAHLSEKFRQLSPIVRFAIPDFGAKDNSQFLRISENTVQKLIDQKLMKLG
jgi:hypothetical protein